MIYLKSLICKLLLLLVVWIVLILMLVVLILLRRILMYVVVLELLVIDDDNDNFGNFSGCVAPTATWCPTLVMQEGVHLLLTT